MTTRLALVVVSSAAVFLLALVPWALMGSQAAQAAQAAQAQTPSTSVSLSSDPAGVGVNFGDATYDRGTGSPGDSETVGAAGVPGIAGYWVASADGGVFSYGDAHFYGSAGNLTLAAPVVGIASTPDGGGYWLAAADGGVFSFGDAQFYGSEGGTRLNATVVGIAPTPDGGGYWLVAADGGVFSFGDANFLGSLGGVHLNAPVVGIAAAPVYPFSGVSSTSTPRSDQGYWLVAADGGVFTFGDAPFYGSAADLHLTAAVVGIAPAPDGHGYWLVAADGGVFTYGDAQFYGSAGGSTYTNPIAAVAVTADGGGYWLVPSIPAPVPGVPVLGEPVGSYGADMGLGYVKTPEVDFNGDEGSYVMHITWSSWGGTRATGTGTANYASPSQFEYQAKPYPATVVAFDRGVCNGIYMYEAVEWYFPQFGGTFSSTTYENVCSGTSVYPS
jgi:hypothetical protein